MTTIPAQTSVQNPLTNEEIIELRHALPDLGWMRLKDEDWQAVALSANWRSWIDEWAQSVGKSWIVLHYMLKLCKNRQLVRTCCYKYLH